MRIATNNKLINIFYSSGVTYPAPINITYFWNFGIFILLYFISIHSNLIVNLKQIILFSDDESAGYVGEDTDSEDEEDYYTEDEEDYYTEDEEDYYTEDEADYDAFRNYDEELEFEAQNKIDSEKSKSNSNSDNIDKDGKDKNSK